MSASHVTHMPSWLADCQDPGLRDLGEVGYSPLNTVYIGTDCMCSTKGIFFEPFWSGSLKISMDSKHQV